MLTTSKDSRLTPSDAAFVQERVASFGLLAAGGDAFFLVIRIVRISLGGELNMFKHPSLLLHGVGALFFLGVWVVCRGPQRSMRLVRAVESAGVLGGCGALAMMGAHIPLWGRPDYIVILAVGFAMHARAIYVPSSGRRSLALGAAVGVLVVAGTFNSFLDIDVANWAQFEPEMATFAPQEVAWALSLNAAAWWVLTVVVTTLASRVIFGLRREVKDARQLGQYRLEAKLGQGGMGVVYRARHAMLRRPTAIKLLLPQHSGNRSLQRFEKEVQLTAGLAHPNVVTIFDYGRTPDGLFYYAMELIPGATLARIVEVTGSQSAGRTVHVMRQAAAALVEAHGAGLIHRDIKPANIMLHLPHGHGGVTDAVTLLDFGLVKEREGDASLTMADAVTGTPAYMAPESIRDPDGVDHRADIYAMGAVGYFMLTGQHVFTGNNALEVCSKHLTATVQRPSDVVDEPVPDDLDQLIVDCLEKDPDRRPQCALELDARLAVSCESRSWGAQQASEWWEEYGAALALDGDGRGEAPNHQLTVDVASLRQRMAQTNHT